MHAFARAKFGVTAAAKTPVKKFLLLIMVNYL